MEETVKCIQSAGKIERVKDKIADEAAREGEASFTTKQAWRKADPEWKKRSDSNKTAIEQKEKKKNEVVA